MIFEKQTHKKIINELGFDADHDYVADDISADLFIAVTNRVQKQGFIYKDKEPIPTQDGLLCEEIADILSDIR